jgi:hypothetical protein
MHRVLLRNTLLLITLLLIINLSFAEKTTVDNDRSTNDITNAEPPLGPIWHKIGHDYNIDISGIVCIEHDENESKFIVVHDNKYPDEVRIGVVTYNVKTSKTGPTYYPLQWDDNFEKPIDIETLARHPDGIGFFMLTSKGQGTHFDVSDDLKSISILRTFKVPIPVEHRPNIEGFQVIPFIDTWWVFWGDRGSNDRPANLFWGRMDPQTFEIEIVNQTTIKVPWPTLDEVRHLSELRVDSAGVLYISCASEGSDDGPFDGAVYVAGVFKPDGQNLRFVRSFPMVPLFRFPGYKIEAFDLVPGENGGIVCATDNENLGSHIFINWYGQIY